MSENNQWNAASSQQHQRSVLPSSDTGGRDEPLQLIQFVREDNGDDTTIQLNEKTLSMVLQKAKNRPLCILCICGPSRQGKSFMLGHMIRCLESLEEGDSDWMARAGSAEALSGFKFQNGDKPETQGIWIWSRPFIVKNDQDEEVAVFLMDTQGTNDEFTRSKDMSAIVGLSLLTSSVMIFNFFTNLQEDILGALHMYMQYGKLALDNNVKGSPFQKLVFLIRDWNNPIQYPYGNKGGKKFLDEKLKIKPDQPLEAKQLREAVNSCFEEVHCFLMPHIGEQALSPAFTGSVAELTSKFKDNMEKFINSVTSPETMVIKKILNNVVTAEELMTFLNNYVVTFNSSDMPTAKSMWEATSEVHNGNVVRKAKEMFSKAMTKLRQGKIYFPPHKMEKSQVEAEQEVLKYFDTAKKLGLPEKIAEFRAQLKDQIAQEKADVTSQNDLRREKYLKRVTDDAIADYKALMTEAVPLCEEDASTFHDETLIHAADQKARGETLTEFREKLEHESPEELEALVGGLECDMKYILAAILNQNKAHRAEAEKCMLGLVSQLATMAEEELQAFRRGNELVNCDHLLKSYEFTKETALQKFKNEKKPGSRDFQREYQEKLGKQLEGIHSKIENEHKLHLQDVRQQVENCIQRICRVYANYLEEYKQGTTQETLTKIHQQQCHQILEEFTRQDNPYPEGHPLRAEALEKLEEHLKVVFDPVFHKLTDWLRQCEESHKKAVEENYSSYCTAMKRCLEEVTFVSEEELVTGHVDIMEEAFKGYDASEKVGDSDVTDQFRLNLRDKITSHFEDIKASNEKNRRYAENQAQKCVLEGQKVYEGKLSEEFDNVQTSDEFKTLHQRAERAAVDWFQRECPGQEYPEFVEDYLEKLREGISDIFKETEGIFEMKRNQEDVAMKAVLLDCRDNYDAEMSKHCQNTRFINADHLRELHQQACTAVMTKFMNRPDPPNDALKRDLQTEMDKMYIKHDRDNNMKLNSMGGAPAIGIDLGTTHCCIAVFIDGEVVYIPNRNEANNETTPSYVAFDERGNKIFGNTAKEGAHENPENTIYDAKRIIGKTMGDRELQNDMKFWPFKVVEDEGVPKISVRGKLYFPEQISAELLKEFRVMAEQHLDLPPGSISKAVITVPAYFNEGQRRATKNAGDLAGFEVLTILDEPTAAAIAYSLERFDSSDKQALIFDLGGGTFDVAILNVSPGKIDIVTKTGDTHLGGEDFDKEMMRYCSDCFMDKERIDLMEGKDSSNENERYEARRRIRRLQTKCEGAKKILTSGRTATVQVDGICNGRDLRVEITRDKFEELNRHHFGKAIEILDKALRDKNLRKEDIDDVVLVGGSTRIPLVKNMLKEYFGGAKALNESIDPDKAVAYGAAVKAAIMNGQQGDDLCIFTEDVAPYSLGIEVVDKSLSVIIPKDTKIPTKLERNYYTVEDNQTNVHFKVYQGENRIAADNELLGEFILDNIPPAPAGHEVLPTIMEIDFNGILHVEAVCQSTQGRKKITIRDNRKGMNEATKRRLIEEGHPAA